MSTNNSNNSTNNSTNNNQPKEKKTLGSVLLSILMWMVYGPERPTPCKKLLWHFFLIFVYGVLLLISEVAGPWWHWTMLVVAVILFAGFLA